MAPSAIKKLKQLEDENRRPKGLVANLTLASRSSARHFEKKNRASRAMRGGSRPSVEAGFSSRHAVRITGWPRSTFRYQSQAADHTPLRMHLRELALARPRSGCRRQTVLLRREGWQMNSKQVYRIYREEGLKVRVKRRKKLASHARVRPPASGSVNERWSVDFVADSLFDGRRI